MFVQQCCAFQQIHANPLRRANEGCQYCYSWRPGLQPASGSQRLPVQYSLARFLIIAVLSSLSLMQGQDLYPAIGGLIQIQMRLQSVDWTLPYLLSPG